MARMVKAAGSVSMGRTFTPRGPLLGGYPDNGRARAFSVEGAYGPVPFSSITPFRAMARYTASPTPNRSLTYPGLRRP